MAEDTIVKKASEKVDLQHDISVNGVTYTAGTQSVPAEVAGDLRRMDREYTAHVLNRHKSNVFERNMGSMAAGGRA